MFGEPVKLLITGAEGQAGSEIARLADADPDFNVLALGRRKLDVTSEQSIQAQLDAFLPDYVINCAGFNRVDAAEHNPDLAFSINAEGPRLLALACGELSIPMLHLSTDYVFDGQYASGYTEDYETAPLGIYGLSKLQGEEAIRQVLPRHIILRTSWLFSESGDNYMLRLLDQARRQEVIHAYNDRRGCPTPASDLARVAIAILKQLSNGAEGWGTYHYCGAEVTTRYGFSETIIAAARQYEELAVIDLVPVSSDEYPSDAQRPASCVLKCKKILNTFGVRQRPWRSELQRLIRHYYESRVEVL
ncbi:dTDP-4-dehydrorhamnose reductase [Nitrincola alkalilacustris]|uniref:dTDP-4-dehydrorhamnose reductase n=1 Tax=Nitrincola alkalilacustris TaxID=1571224 RepID=UPI00124E397D|nr:dTDP-4-dehydrorhamnose reductase [Nitrincola alkalilacustris]